MSTRQGRWHDNTPQQPTVAVVQNVNVPSPLSAGAGTGANPNFVGVAFGTGAPTFRAPNGTIYIRFDGTHGGTNLIYLNTSGASTIGTSWTAVL